MPKCPKCQKEVYFAEKVAMRSMMGSLIATTLAMLPCLDQKGLAVEGLKATPSNEVQGWKDGIGCGFQQFHKS
ncbi:LIM zinc-binding domain-containing protein [Podarcis lilfordi]|uniref:LIM zinc-binding domain-containing protein n=1 Tax=Podarcis lilfordi TaxID=74358 RepID=A0AA35P8M3_9SAUR|nr:LIM zinc-binding domain-containing protein [Podarcis lilfordi]